jgi:hypothetical protein
LNFSLPDSMAELKDFPGIYYLHQIMKYILKSVGDGIDRCYAGLFLDNYRQLFEGNST